jgi:hypothetical protein
MNAPDLYARISDLFRDAHTDAGAAKLLGEVRAAWPDMRDRVPSPEDGEICRLAMLASFQTAIQPDPEAAVWRARALSRFAATGWTEAVGAVAMGEAFRMLALANGDYEHGRTLDLLRPAPHARAVLEELQVYLAAGDSGIRLGPSAPSPAVLERFLHEKCGFLLLVEGDLEAARASYARAAEAVRGHRRGEIKVALGAALVEYVGARSTGEGSADATDELIAAAESAGQSDLVATARHNVDVMRAGGGDLLGYEIL